MTDTTILDGVTFTADMKTLVCYPREKTDTLYRVPDGVEEIGEEAFLYYDLRTLVLPSGLKETAQYAFFCPVLETLYIPASLERVCLKAFANCGSLKNIYFEGMREKWNGIFIADCNSTFEKAEKSFGRIYERKGL